MRTFNRHNRVLLVLILALASITTAQSEPPKYESVSLVTASDVGYPPAARSAGMVTLDVTVDSSGAVQTVQAARNVPPLTKAAEDAVRQWNFHPATKDDEPVSGVIRVNVVFNPFNPSDVSIPNKPLPQPEGAAANVPGVFRPSDVKSADYAVYPPNTVASGAVILDVQIAEDGSVQDVSTVRGAEPLTSASSKALQNWQFTPATYEAKPIVSHEIVAFVFVRPEIGTM
jgi:TonB family protein